MSRREIRVNPEELGALAYNLGLAHETLATSPCYAHLEAGDVWGRLPGAVSDFITKNEKPRDELIQQLDVAARALGAAARTFGETESNLARALTGRA